MSDDDGWTLSLLPNPKLDHSVNCYAQEAGTRTGEISMIQEKQKSLDDEDLAKEQDDYLDEALKETFPASDPISPGHAEKTHPNIL